MTLCKKFAVTVFAMCITISAITQEALTSIEEEYYDFLSLTGAAERPTLGYRTLSDNEWTITDDAHNVWANNNLGTKYTLFSSDGGAANWFTEGLRRSAAVRVYGPEWYNSYNDKLPYGQNDGALWQGKGYNTSLTAGVRLETYGFELTFKPQISFSQNKDFDFLPGVNGNKYSYFTNTGGYLDLVQRYGDSSFWTYDWGDSEVRWTWKKFTVGFGTQNPWIGPAKINPMLGSNNAAGYPKLDWGLRKFELIVPGLGWDLGELEARMWVGQLQMSDYFDTSIVTNNNDTSKKHMLTGMTVAYAPSAIPGLTIGLNRIYVTTWKKSNLKTLGRLINLAGASLNSTASGNDEDQKLSLFLDWTFPSIGFEVYGEYGKDDDCPIEADPFHTGIYTIGCQQEIPLNSKYDIYSKFNLELNFFEMSQDYQLAWNYLGFYSHGAVYSGYTNKGQILGAGTGYFGNSQYLSYTVYYPKGNTKLYFHRYCNNNNYILNMAVNNTASAVMYTNGNRNWETYETYLVFGISTDYFITKSLLIGGSAAYMKILHHNYVNTPTASDGRIKTFALSFTLKYNF